MSLPSRSTVRDHCLLCLDLCTAHMPNSDPDWGPHRAAQHEYGFTVFICGDQTDPEEWAEHVADSPEWLRPVLLAAASVKAKMLNFDRDADLMDGLPSWEW